MQTSFHQSRKIGVAGLFTNQLMGNNETRPEVGKGATMLHYSDRTPYQVLEVSKDGKTAVIERMEATPASKNLPMGHQSWELTPSGQKSTIIWRNNAWRLVIDKIKFEPSFIASLPNPDGGIAPQLSPKLHQQVYNGGLYPQNIIPGVTKATKEYNKISILFGRMENYYDWEF